MQNSEFWVMGMTETGQSLLETMILNGLIATGVIVIWSICQENIGEYLQFLLDLIAKPVP